MPQETSHQSFARHLTFGIASLPRSVAVEVVFDAAPAAVLGELEESLGLFEARDGQTVLRARTDSIDWLARRLAGVSFNFHIVEPDALRTALRHHAERLMRALDEGRS
jgi:predicted DNA-binding transcriptional regulator YafY